ncbi:ATP-binding protein [Massilia endophytica]|uniref:ATP-binding protein n=1 Tax=Massilia endophytica TaxID=2899220 RepID=UPI001E2EEEDA|nr:ATP-binding protein [Massilia endophytica]UGQ48434.1 ATP-binding protein [Massilia endophytica]
MGRLFWKFFLSILLAQIAATVAIGGAVWLKNREADKARQPDLDMGPPAELAIESAAATLRHGGTDALRELLENMDRHRVFAVDEQGKELLGRIVKPNSLAEARLLLEKGDERAVRRLTTPDGQRYILFLPAHERQRGPLGGDARPLIAGAGLPMPGAQREFGGERPPPPPDSSSQPPPDGPGGPDGPRPRFQPLTPFIPLAAAVLASLVFAALLAWYFARPIRSLRQAFEAASGGDLAPRFAQLGLKGGDELSDLGRDFDRMTGRLRSLMDAQTRLMHDVSHELRSPLARLQAAIGLANQQPEKMLASMERIERESIRMDKLVGELLTLARLESGALDEGKEDIDMAELLGQLLDDAQFEAATHGRRLEQHGEGAVIILGKPDLLARAIENVVRNAIKHSPLGETVVVEMETDAEQLRVRVLDRGPGVAAQDLAAIFQPFYRSEGTQKDVEGHGLGLAIAQQVVQQHGGTISAANRDGGGLRVEIALPLA